MYNRKVYNGSIEEPYRNPKAPIHFVTGSAGCEEQIDPFKKQPSDWSAKRIPDYGITELQVLNRTHVHLKQLSTVKVVYLILSFLFLNYFFLILEWNGC